MPNRELFIGLGAEGWSVRPQIAAARSRDERIPAAVKDGHDRTVFGNLGAATGRPPTVGVIGRPHHARTFQPVRQTWQLGIVGRQPLELQPTGVVGFKSRVVRLIVFNARIGHGVSGPELRAQARGEVGSVTQQRQARFNALPGFVSVPGHRRVGPIHTVGGEIADGIRDRAFIAEAHVRQQEHHGVRRGGADGFVHQKLVFPIFGHPVRGRKVHRLILRFEEHVGAVFVTRPVEPPEVENEIHRVDGSIFTVAPNRDDQIQIRLRTPLHQDVAIGRVVTHGIGVPRGIAFQIQVHGVVAVLLGQSVKRSLAGHELGLAAVRISAIPRQTHATQQRALVAEQTLEPQRVVDDRAPPLGLRFFGRQQQSQRGQKAWHTSAEGVHNPMHRWQHGQNGTDVELLGMKSQTACVVW